MDEPLFEGPKSPQSQLPLVAKVWQGRFEPKFSAAAAFIGILRIDLCQEVIHMNGPPVQNRPTNCGSTSDGVPTRWFRRISKLCHSLKAVTNDPHDHSISCIAQPGRVLRNHVQHWLDVRRRAGDDTQDFTRGGLLLQRFQFLEKADVLDGDHGLVREGFEESDLFFGEWPDFLSSNYDTSNSYSLSQ